MRKKDQGGAHSEYFLGLSRALAEAGLAHPTLVIDRARMLGNAAAVAHAVGPRGLPVRLVVKSLPSFGLLDPLSRVLRTQR